MGSAGNILVCSKKRSSVLAASNVLVSSSPSPSSSSFSDSSAPRGLVLVSPKVEETLGDAKLVLLAAAADPNPPATPPNPVVPEAAEKGLADLKTEDVDAPRVPNGDFSEPAKPPNADPANAELEAGLSALAGVSADNGDFAPASFANGESAAALAKALVEKS